MIGQSELSYDCAGLVKVSARSEFYNDDLMVFLQVNNISYINNCL